MLRNDPAARTLINAAETFELIAPRIAGRMLAIGASDMDRERARPPLDHEDAIAFHDDPMTARAPMTMHAAIVLIVGFPSRGRALHSPLSRTKAGDAVLTIGGTSSVVYALAE